MEQYFTLFLEYLFPVVLSVLAVLTAILIRKLPGLLGLKLSNEANESFNKLLNDIVAEGVSYAEQWAKNRMAQVGEKPAGNDKLRTALDYILQQVNSYGLLNIVQDELIKKIEAFLGIATMNQNILEKSIMEDDNDVQDD